MRTFASMRRAALLLATLSAAACSSGTFAVVTLQAIGSSASPVHSVDLQLTLAGKSAQTTVHERSGGDLMLPTDAALQIRSGTGTLSITAIARDAAGAELGRGSASVDIASNKTSRVSVPIDFTGGVVTGDMGAGDMQGGMAPMLTIDHQPSYDFGTVVVGTTSSAATFAITNSGGSPTGALTAAALGGANADQFAIGSDGCTGMTLAAGATCVVTVTMHPTSAATPAATLTVSATPGGSTSIALGGTAVTPGALALAPSPAAFNPTVINGGTDDVTVTVTNSGGAASGAVSMAIGGSDANQFSITGGTCAAGPTLAPGGTCTSIIRFAPTSPGAKAATLTANATPGGPGVANLQGTGLTGSMLAFLTVSPFGTVAAGSSTMQTVTLKNNGTQDSGPLGTPTLTGDASFSIVAGGTCAAGTPVPGGMTCTYNIKLAPTTFGSKAATLSVSGTPGGTAMASLAGTGSQVFTLTVNSGGNGSGTVSIDGTTCASVPCTKMYTVTGSTSASVGESAATSSNFGGWSGDCSGTGACSPAMSQNRSVTAAFTLKKINVTVNLALVHNATGTVTATSSPSGPALACTAGVCSAQYDYGTTVTLTAAGTSGSLFQSWAATPCASRYSTSCGTGSLTADFSTTVTFRPQINYVFETSQTFMPNTFVSDFSGADLDCDAAAKAAGLYNSSGSTPTHFKAWLSTGGTGGVTAKSRLGSARGSIRVDGLEFADTLASTPTTIFYPPNVNENGVVDNSEYAATGTLFDGTADYSSTSSDNTCNNWTFPLPATGSHYIQLGDPTAGSGNWTNTQINTACSAPWKLLCFETAYSTAVLPTAPASKRYAFVSTSTWAPTGGRGPGAGSADAVCAADKGSLPGTYVALMSTSTSPASDATRLSGSGALWVRPDGVVLATSTANLFAGVVQAPIDQQSDGTYLHGFNQVWTGATSPNAKSATAAAHSCGDWATAADTGDYAFLHSSQGWFNFPITGNCTTAARVYCLQQ